MLAVGILTVSDSCFNKVSEDKSGPNLRNVLHHKLKLTGREATVVQNAIVPDDVQRIESTLLNWCDELKLGLILVTGGTGFSRRDMTPEATRKVIQREAPGLSQLMMSESLKVTKLAVLSRAVCGIRDESLIINLPGSMKASEECLTFLLPVLPHALDVLHGYNKNVKSVHSDLQAEGAKTSQKTYTAHHMHSCPLHSPPSQGGSTLVDDPNYVARRHRHSPWPLKSVDEAIQIILDNTSQCDPEIISYKQALGRYLAQDVCAAGPLPPFPASIKDGYAVIASDGAGVRDVIDASTAGDFPSLILKPGQCVRINTGAVVPKGADAVVQVEDTKLVQTTPDSKEELQVEITKAPKVGLDIRPIGSDIAQGELVLTSGMKLKPAELGILATVGQSEVKCYKLPNIGVMSTGNELTEPENSRLDDGKIRDSNRITLISSLAEHGIQAKDLGIAKDTYEDVKRMFEDAFDNCSIVITSGGVSMGEKDLVKTVLINEFKANIHFGRVFMKPGKPTTFGTVEYKHERKLFFGLPGNPVSATVTFNLFVLPALLKMCGSTQPMPMKWKVKLMSDLHLDPRPEYMRAIVHWKEGETTPYADITGNQISSRLLSVCSAQILVILPPKTKEQEKVTSGTVCDAILLKQ